MPRVPTSLAPQFACMTVCLLDYAHSHPLPHPLPLPPLYPAVDITIVADPCPALPGVPAAWWFCVVVAFVGSPLLYSPAMAAAFPITTYYQLMHTVVPLLDLEGSALYTMRNLCSRHAPVPRFCCLRFVRAHSSHIALPLFPFSQFYGSPCLVP